MIDLKINTDAKRKGMTMTTPMAMTPIEFLGNLVQQVVEGDEGQTDLLEVLEKIHPLLSEHHWKQLSMQFDVCPWHVCDIDICMDDDEDCAIKLDQEFPDTDLEGKS